MTEVRGQEAGVGLRECAGVRSDECACVYLGHTVVVSTHFEMALNNASVNMLLACIIAHVVC